MPYRSGSFQDPKATTTTPLGQILKTASSGEGPSPFRSLPNVMRARAFADERGLAMGGGRPTERRFTVGDSGKSVARCHCITQAILDGRQPRGLTADKLLEHSRLPLAWRDQRTVLGFA